MSIQVDAYLLYCKEQYERDLAAELETQSAKLGCFGYAVAKPNSAHMRFNFYQAQTLDSLPLAKLIFARQLVGVLCTLDFSDTDDRISAVLDFLKPYLADLSTPRHPQFLLGDVRVEYPETEDGKSMAKFCKKFTVPLRQALRKNNLLSAKPNSKLPYLHLFFERSDQCVLGMSAANNRSEHLLGIERLKFPQGAPSRSTLKLEEAINSFLSKEQQASILSKGMSAVDLGACPGGWTYQMVARGIKVEAVDNGAMDDALMATGLVSYQAADGFKYQPQDGHVDWLICDMIEKPEKVANLMLDWLLSKRTTSTIFNLKLPMKSRYQTVQPLLEHISATLNEKGIDYDMQAKHLYHDRDEVTVMIVSGAHLSALQFT